jgi:hypothetical protein
VQISYHPVTTLVRAVTIDFNLYSLGCGVVFSLDSPRQLRQVSNSLRLDEFLVVQVIKQNVQTLLGVLHLGREGCWRRSSNALHILRQNFYQLLRVGRDVRAITRGVLRRGWRRRRLSRRRRCLRWCTGGYTRTASHRWTLGRTLGRTGLLTGRRAVSGRRR